MNKDKNPGLWDISVAGHVSAGQDAISAAVREIYEEISPVFTPFSSRTSIYSICTYTFLIII